MQHVLEDWLLFNMKKKIYICAIIMGLILAAPINQSKALKVAQNVFIEFSDKTSFKVLEIDIIEAEAQTLFYIYHYQPNRI